MSALPFSRRSTVSWRATAAPCWRWAVLAGIASLAAMTQLRFDSNPLDLRSPKVESVSTLFDLMKNPQTSPNTIDVPAPSLAAADALAVEIGQESLVAQVLTLSSFVPQDQPRKLALIADANNLLDATINPFEVAPPPSDDRACQKASSPPRGKLREAAKGADKPAQDARRLAAALDALVKAGPAPGPTPPRRWCRASRPCWVRFPGL